MNIVERHVENEGERYIVPMEALLSELNSATAKEIELHPSYTQALQDQSNLYRGYKLRERSSAVDRILIVNVDGFEFTVNSRGNLSFRPETAERIKVEIQSFWDGENTERVRVKYIPGNP